MKNNNAVTLFVVVLIAVVVTGFLWKITSVAYSEGLQKGAKIGIALESPQGYRAEEVRGSCEDLFDSNECVSCHSF